MMNHLKKYAESLCCESSESRSDLRLYRQEEQPSKLTVKKDTVDRRPNIILDGEIILKVRN